LKETDGCWACQLARGDLRQHKTRWHCVGLEGAVVDDLNARGHALRLLYVPKEHVSCGDETPEMRAVAVALLTAVGLAVCANEGLLMRKFDLAEHSYRAHWHAQLCLDRVGG
jgi:hypothetical protein